MEKLAYSIKEAVAATGMGKTTLYSHIGAGHLPTVKIGNRTCITADALKEFVSKDWPVPATYKKHK